MTKARAAVAVVLVLGGMALSFLLLALLSFAGPFAGVASLVVYVLDFGLIMPFVLFVAVVGMPSWSGMKRRWRAMHRLSYKW